jgi:DNA-binding NtrC family response regulator
VSDSVLDVIVISFREEELKNVLSLLLEMPDTNYVSTFDNFSKAESHLRHHQVDFALLDADDDEMGWIIPYKRMRTVHPNLKIVLMSSSSNAAVKAYEAGVWDYLLKPVKEDQLIRIIEKCR